MPPVDGWDDAQQERKARKRVSLRRSHLWTGVPFVVCERCDKRAFHSRKEARRVRQPKNHTYPCPHREGFWHNGHLKPEVLRGEVHKDDYYGPRGVGRSRYRRSEQPGA